MLTRAHYDLLRRVEGAMRGGAPYLNIHWNTPDMQLAEGLQGAGLIRVHGEASLRHQDETWLIITPAGRAALAKDRDDE